MVRNYNEYGANSSNCGHIAGVVGFVVIISLIMFSITGCSNPENKHPLGTRIYQCFTKSYENTPNGYDCYTLKKQAENCTLDLIEGRSQSPKCRELFSLINKIRKGDYTPYVSNGETSIVQLDRPEVNTEVSSEGGGLGGHIATTVGAYYSNGGAHNPNNQYGNIGWNPYKF